MSDQERIAELERRLTALERLVRNRHPEIAEQEYRAEQLRREQAQREQEYAARIAQERAHLEAQERKRQEAIHAPEEG